MPPCESCRGGFSDKACAASRLSTRVIGVPVPLGPRELTIFVCRGRSLKTSRELKTRNFLWNSPAVQPDHPNLRVISSELSLSHPPKASENWGALVAGGPNSSPMPCGRRARSLSLSLSFMCSHP